MTRTILSGLLALSVAASACASRGGNSMYRNSPERLTSATVTFNTLDNAKDAKSAVTVQLMRFGNELVAEAVSAGTEYDDNAAAPPLALSLTDSTVVRNDLQSSSIRLRLTPDGDDTWTFNVSLRLRFADNTEQTFAWSGIELDEDEPQRTLVLQGARQSE